MMKKHKAFHELWNKQGKKIYPINSPKDRDHFIENESAYISTLQIEKLDLNTVKSKLDQLDISLWHRHTSNMHKFSSLAYKLRSQIKAELPTQAWAKFYSILCEFNLVPSNKQIFSSFHLCEAPGAFITSLNHFIKNRVGLSCRLDWCATTLNPYFEGNDLGQMIPDDRFIINSLNCWDFGPDFTGNIMHPSSLEYFVEKFRHKEIDLITADGSIDCSDNPSEQELTVAQLFLWEIITALSILVNKGSFVLKMFTFFEKCSIAYLYMIAKVFDEVTLCKPGPSKPGNSEVYIVATGFNADLCFNLDLFQQMKEAAYHCSDPQIIGDLIDISKIPACFLNSLRYYVEESCSLQKEAIQNNLLTFEKIDKAEQQNLNKVKDYFARMYIEDYEIKPIEEYVSPMFAMMSSQGQYKNQKQSMNSKSGSFSQRTKGDQNSSNFSGTPKRDNDWVKLCSYDSFEWNIAGAISRTINDLFPLDMLKNIQPVLGKGVSRLQSSNYCAPLPLLTYTKPMPAVQGDRMSSNSFVDYLMDNPQVSSSKVKFVSTDDQFSDHFLRYQNSNNVKIEKLEIEKHDLHVEDTTIDENVTLVINLPRKRLSKDDKLAVVTFLLDCFKFIQTSQNVCFHFTGLLLSNFWVGIFFLTGKLFKSVRYSCCADPRSNMVLILERNKFVGSDFKTLYEYLKRIQTILGDSSSTKDVLHIVNLKFLMQSDFRKYIKMSNEHFVENILT